MRQKAVSTEEFNTNTTQEIEIPMTEEIYRGDEMFNDKFEVVQEAEFKDFHETEKFMKDILTVELPISDSKQSQFVQVYVQGVPQLFQRGAKQKVKRMFVEALARARPYTIQTPEYIDANGDKATKIVKTWSLADAFHVLHDPAGDKGFRWLENILMQAS